MEMVFLFLAIRGTELNDWKQENIFMEHSVGQIQSPGRMLSASTGRSLSQAGLRANPLSRGGGHGHGARGESTN